MKFSVVDKRHFLVAVLLLGLAVLVATAPSRAKAATPAHTDVMFVFDTTGSMGGALNEAQEEIQEAMTQIGTSLPDVQFGLSEVNDYNEVSNPGTFEYGIGDGFAPWALHVPITSNQAAVSAGLATLEAEGGGDNPEAYGRGLYESDANPAIGWRPGARGVIVLVADNVPHDNELNDGIPSSLWFESPFNTGIDPGPDNTVGTPDDLDWQAVLQKLILDGRPLEFVDYHGEEGYFPYWQNWAGRTGGSALESSDGNLVAQLVELVKAGAAAPLPACPAGQIRDLNEHCAVPPPPSNSFKIEPRISCAKGCHVVSVKIVFDSAGNVIGESVLEEEAKGSSVSQSQSGALLSASRKTAKCGGPKKAKSSARSARCKRPAQIKPFTQAVVAGANTLQLKLTGSALKTLHKKGKLPLKVRLTFTPTGGTASAQVHTFLVKLPKKGPHKPGHSKGGKH